MADRDAEYLVNMVRDLINEKGGDSPYRDGFADDADFADMSKNILRAINSAQRRLAATDYIVCDFTITLSVGTDNARNDRYPVDTEIHRILSVVLFDPVTSDAYPLSETSYASLEQRSIRRRNRSVARPRHWFWYGTSVIGFDESPDKAYEMQALATTYATDLVNRIDTPDRLPGSVQDILAYGAALELSNMDHREEARSRIPFLAQQWSWHWNELLKISRSRPMHTTSGVSVGGYNKRFRGYG